MKFHFRFFLLHVIFRRALQMKDLSIVMKPVNIRSSHITITSLKICNVSAFQLKIRSWPANTMFFSLKGQPKKINNLTFTFLELGKT